jgi:SMI1/KNR4 family protein SUKH-1
LSEIDPVRIQRTLLRLRSGKAIPEVFGANGHKFAVNPTLSEAEVLAFETLHRVRLPADYREFLLRIGNGGAGPYYGVFPLGQMDDIEGTKPWRENDGFVGALSEPFALTNDWNDLTGMPSDDLINDEQGEYEKQMDEFDKRYWHASLMNGAVPICHEGCALRIWLVAAGEQTGRLWRDRRADYHGVAPVITADGAPATFSEWYNEWLDRSVLAATNH